MNLLGEQGPGRPGVEGGQVPREVGGESAWAATEIAARLALDPGTQVPYDVPGWILRPVRSATCSPYWVSLVSTSARPPVASRKIRS